MVRALLTIVLSALLIVRVLPASAQEQGLGGSFITPFPDNDVYQVQVVGDWLAEGLLGGLVEAFTVGPGVSISKKRYDLSGLMRSNSANDLAQLEQTFGTDPSHIAIVMLGAQDRYSISRRRGAEAENDEWRGEYGARVDRLMKLLKKGNRAVYWVGLPNMRRFQDNERAQRMNDVIRERAYLNGARYIDAYASFIDESGGYSDWGPDITGKVRRLRDSDGVHFTQAGYLKLAHFVERELKRDIAQARTERSIPLAGDAAEQSRVNPEKVRLKAESNARRRRPSLRRAAAAAAATLRRPPTPVQRTGRVTKSSRPARSTSASRAPKAPSRSSPSRSCGRRSRPRSSRSSRARRATTRLRRWAMCSSIRSPAA